ncbi:MAG: PAS domain-containing protein [Janthinobacterium lividum]
MKHVVSRDLHAYWDALRGKRTAPERADIDPAAIRHILAYTFVLEIPRCDKPVRARKIDVRLSGTRINALFGHDLKGCSFERLWSPGAGSTVDAMLDSVLDERAAIVAGATGGPPGRCPVDIEVLLLPLRHHGSTHSRIFGSMVAHDSPGWMGLAPIDPLDLRCFRTLIGGAASHDRTTPAPQCRPSWSEPVSQADNARRPTMPKQIGRFRVYNGGGEGRALG